MMLSEELGFLCLGQLTETKHICVWVHQIFPCLTPEGRLKPPSCLWLSLSFNLRGVNKTKGFLNIVSMKIGRQHKLMKLD